MSKVSFAGGDAYRNLSPSNTGAVVHPRRTKLLGYHITNTGAAFAFVKLYNKATAATSSDTPVLTLGMPNTGGAVQECDVEFGTGLSIRAVTEAADNGTTSPGASEVVVNLFVVKH